MTHVIALAEYKRQNVMQTTFRAMYEASPHKLCQVIRRHVHFPKQTHNNNIALEMHLFCQLFL